MTRTGPGAVAHVRMRPVVAFAVIGAAFFAFEAYVLVAWVVSGDASRTPAGPTEPPDWMELLGRAAEIGSILGLGAFLYLVLIRPWRREGQMTRDGMLSLVFLTLYWQDPLANYWHPWFLYNSSLFNLGSWLGQVPGARAPDAAQMAVPFAYGASQYVVTVLGLTILGGRALGWARRRWPTASRLRLAVCTYLIFVVVDLLVEAIALTRLGLNSFAGATGPTLFAGRWYQFPVIEALVWPATWTTFICLRTFTSDRGETVAERGLETLSGSRARRATVRFLALGGVCNLVMLGLFMVPVNLIAAHARSWPDDVVERSYFTSGTCGAGAEDPSEPCP